MAGQVLPGFSETWKTAEAASFPTIQLAATVAAVAVRVSEKLACNWDKEQAHCQQNLEARRQSLNRVVPKRVEMAVRANVERCTHANSLAVNKSHQHQLPGELHDRNGKTNLPIGVF